MDTWKQLKSTYRKAYHQITTEKPYEDEQKYKTFGSCVAMLCHDNVKNSMPDRIRILYLSKLGDLSGDLQSGNTPVFNLPMPLVMR